MRKTSQDGGDTSSVTDSGIETEKRPSVSIIKSTRDSIKRKVQSLGHDSDETVIEPLLHKEKPEVNNQGTKFSLLKSKGEIITAKESDQERLISEKITKVSMSTIPILTDNKLINDKKQFAGSSNTSTPGYKNNHTNPETKSQLNSKTQLLIEIGGTKPAATYDPSPLIFTTAKIHSDGVTKNLEPYQVTTVPILSTIESGINNFEHVSENGEQSQSIFENKHSLSASYKDNSKASSVEMRNIKDSLKNTTKHNDIDNKSNIDSKLLNNMSSNTIRMTSKETSEKKSPSARNLNEALINIDVNKNISTFSNTNYNVNGGVLNTTKTAESQNSSGKISSGISVAASGSKLLRQKNAITDGSIKIDVEQTVQNSTKSLNDNYGLLKLSKDIDTSICSDKIKEENSVSDTFDRSNTKLTERNVSKASKTRSFSASSSDKPSMLTKTLAKRDKSSTTIKGASLESIAKPVIASVASGSQKVKFDPLTSSPNKMEGSSNNTLTSTTISTCKAISNSSTIQSVTDKLQSNQPVSSSIPLTLGTSVATTTKASAGSSNSTRTSSASSKPNTIKDMETSKSSVSGKQREVIKNSDFKQNVKSSKA